MTKTMTEAGKKEESSRTSSNQLQLEIDMQTCKPELEKTFSPLFSFLSLCMHVTIKLLLLMHMFVMGNLEIFFGVKNQITSFLKFVRYRNPYCCILYGNEGRLMVVSNCSFPYDFSFKWSPQRPSICRCSLKILITLYDFFFFFTNTKNIYGNKSNA